MSILVGPENNGRLLDISDLCHFFVVENPFKHWFHLSKWIFHEMYETRADMT